MSIDTTRFSLKEQKQILEYALEHFDSFLCTTIQSATIHFHRYSDIKKDMPHLYKAIQRHKKWLDKDYPGDVWPIHKKFSLDFIGEKAYRKKWLKKYINKYFKDVE